MMQDAVLFTLEKNKGELVTGGELSKLLGVSRNTIWKTINTLRREGHDISPLPNKGYVLSRQSDGLSQEMITHRLNTKSIGRNLRVLKSTDSTNLYLKALAPEHMVHGMVVIANEQTGGRGRLGRTFLSPADEGIYLSILVKPNIPLTTIRLLTLCSALSVVRAAESICSLRPQLKWVNDIMLGQKKCGGILTEASVSAELQALDYVVIGIGINTGEIPQSLTDIATSIAQETGARGFRNRLISAVLTEFEALYHLLVEEKISPILDEYQSHLNIMGKKAIIPGPSSPCEVVLQRLDHSGALVGRDAQGREHLIVSSEIKIVEET